MKIKDESGNIIGEINLENGASIEDLVKSLSNKKHKSSSFHDLKSIEESSDKKQIVFNFKNGKIFYDLPQKIFVKENGIKIGESSFRNIKLNINNKKYEFRHPSNGYALDRDDFWACVGKKTDVPWIKTFFAIIDIWANKQRSYFSSSQIQRRNKLKLMAEDKDFFDSMESFAKIPKIQSLNEEKLIAFYEGLVSMNENKPINEKRAHQDRCYLNFKKTHLDNWFLDNCDKETSANYFEEPVELIKYAGDYIVCNKEGLREAFQYVFNTYGGVIFKGQISKIKNLIKFGYEQKRLLDYLYRDIYNQGLELNLENHWSHNFGALTTLYDYANMNQEMKQDYEKYPRYLSTYHDVTQKNYQLKEDEILVEKFENRVKELKNKNIEYSDGTYKIIFPKNSKDLVKEGQRLNHCVASYYKRMAIGETNIVFLRKKDKPQESLVTIEINNNNSIIQAKGKGNSNPREPEREFIEKYQNYLCGK